MPTPGHYEYIEINPKLLNEDYSEDTSINDDLPAGFTSDMKKGSAAPIKQRSMAENISMNLFDDANQMNFEPSTYDKGTAALLTQISKKLDRIISLLEEN